MNPVSVTVGEFGTGGHTDRAKEIREAEIADDDVGRERIFAGSPVRRSLPRTTP
jgi:hypothetical protein